MHRTFLFLAVTASVAVAAEWPRFRGPDGSGVASDARNLPVKFSPTENVVWKTPTPPGKSSPVLANRRIYLTGHDGDRLLTLAVDANNGEVLWQHELPRSRQEHRYPMNDPAAPSPATDGQNVYVFFADFGVVSYTAAGKERWRKPLGPHKNTHGIAASPVVHGGRVYAVADQETKAYVTALDTATGKVAWTTERRDATGGSYSTPVVWTLPGRGAALLVLGSLALTAYSTDDGHRLWSVRGFPFQAKSSPFIARNAVVAGVRAPGGDVRMDLGPWQETVKTDKNGDGKLARDETTGMLNASFGPADINCDGFYTEDEHNVWREAFNVDSELMMIEPRAAGASVRWRVQKNVPDVPMPLAYMDTVYTVTTGGILASHDRASGAIRKKGRLLGALGEYYASPVAGDAKIYVLS